MRWITDPARMADALNALLFGDPADADARSAAREHAVNVLTEYRSNNGQIPVLEKHGCRDLELDAMLNWFDDIFRAIAALRSGSLTLDGSRDPDTLSLLHDSLTALVYRLEPRLAGLTSAVIRAHHLAGGTGADLATAMNTGPAAAYKRSLRVRATEPGLWERWALGEHDTAEYPATDLRPGWTVYDENGRRHQVQEVSVYGDGVTEVGIGATSFTYDAGEKATAVPHNIALQETTGFVGSGTPEGQVPVTIYTRARRATR